MIKTVSKSMGNYFSKNIGASAQETAAINYGLEIILGAILKGVMLVSTAWFLGILFPVLVVVVTASALRVISGGAHLGTYFRCVSAGVIIFNLLGYFTQVLIPIYYPFQGIYALLFIATAGVLAAYKYAPADAVVKPNKDKYKKTLLKYYTIGIIIAWFSSMVLLINWLAVYHPNLKYIVVGSALGVLWQSFTITSWGFKLFKLTDDFINNINNKKEVCLNESQIN